MFFFFRLIGCARAPVRTQNVSKRPTSSSSSSPAVLACPQSAPANCRTGCCCSSAFGCALLAVLNHKPWPLSGLSATGRWLGLRMFQNVRHQARVRYCRTCPARVSRCIRMPPPKCTSLSYRTGCCCSSAFGCALLAAHSPQSLPASFPSLNHKPWPLSGCV